MIIKRDRYLQKLIERRHSSYIKIITGIRRCGKSYLLKKLYYDYLLSEGVNKEQIIMVELDDDRFENQREKKQLREYIESKASDSDRQYYIFIDEVQIVKDFEGTVISINNHDNYDVYITGSNSEFLSKDISTRFKDRGSEIRVHPLSFEEYEDIKKFYGKEISPDRQEELQNYILEGGFPRTIQLESLAAKRRYVQSVIDEIYEKDIRRRLKIRNKSTFETVQKYIINNFGATTSLKSLKKAIEQTGTPISEATIARYIKALLLKRKQVS